MIQTIKFKCEILTPMFLAGADVNNPELRAPSIKGALRLWWRALNANLVENEDYSELKKQEAELFGGTDNSGRSKVIISIDNQTTKTITAHPTPHKEKPFSKKAFAVGSTFEMTVNVVDNEVLTAENVKNLFIVVSLLGGIGNRSRRGFGSFKITEVDREKFEQPSEVDGIERLIKLINPAYPFIINMAKYPFVKSIEIGKDATDITKKIGQATHDIKTKNGSQYDNAMGKARGGRFSSPIYVSVIKKDDGKLYPIITTLNTVPPNGKVDESIQEQFKNEL